MTNEITPGTIIKSLDFNGNPDFYMIGRVIRTDEHYIYCETISVNHHGKEKTTFNLEFRTLKQGYLWTDNDVLPRVSVVTPNPPENWVKIVLHPSLKGVESPYGRVSDVSKKFIVDFYGEEFSAVRESLNYYRLKNGTIVHIYNASEVK